MDARLLVMFKTASPPKQLPGCRWLRGSYGSAERHMARKSQAMRNITIKCQARKLNAAVRVVAAEDAAFSHTEPYEAR